MLKPFARIILLAATLSAASALLSGCAYDPYAGGYVPYAYPAYGYYAYPYGTYPAPYYGSVFIGGGWVSGGHWDGGRHWRH